jgi:hypothetical protein
MVIGYHVILGARGFWLPNDPRGSGSSYVWRHAIKYLEEKARLKPQRWEFVVPYVE